MSKKHYHPLTMIGAGGLVWNVIGLAALIGEAQLSPSARYTMTAAQRALADLTPNWAVAGSILAVLAGIVGCAGLMMRRSWSILLLALSLLGVVAQDSGVLMAAWFAGTTPSGFTLALQALVLIVAGLLLILSVSAYRARELR